MSGERWVAVWMPDFKNTSDPLPLQNWAVSVCCRLFVCLTVFSNESHKLPLLLLRTVSGYPHGYLSKLKMRHFLATSYQELWHFLQASIWHLWMWPVFSLPSCQAVVMQLNYWFLWAVLIEKVWEKDERLNLCLISVLRWKDILA